MEILNFKPINKGCLVAKFDVRIDEWGLTIRSCSLFAKEGREWIALPSQQFQDKEGKKKSYDFVVFDKDRRSRFENACLEKIRANVASKKPEQNNGLPF